MQDSFQVLKPLCNKEESLLQRLWTGLFDDLTRDVTATDHFFRLGGDSMAAMRLVSPVRQQGMTLTVEKIFKHPVLRDLAYIAMPQKGQVGEAKMTRADAAPLLPFSLLQSKDFEPLRSQVVQQCRVESSQIEDIYPVPAIQHRFMTGAFVGSLSDRTPAKCRQKIGSRDEQSQLVSSLPSLLDLDEFKEVGSVVIVRHPILRTRIVDTDRGVFQAVIDQSPVWTCFT